MSTDPTTDDSASSSDTTSSSIPAIPTNPNSQNPNSRTPLKDPADPYYLHHIDNPGNILVSQPFMGQDNYASWSRAMKLSVSVKNKLGFLDGSIMKPPLTDSTLYNVVRNEFPNMQWNDGGAEFPTNAWIRNNNIVISQTLNSVSKEIFASILYNESAANIWSDLRTRFHQKNGPHIFNLHKELMNLKQDVQSVNMCYRPVCTCNHCTCGGVKKLQEHYHMEYVMSFLMGLKDSYS
ncbi:uncharacterized protein LOC133806670 [Humulus lupulus]|uniref:uncharacterized protein LOC133806670 n=1 Tax=Humulus lupulus TaxID=3486 RepID=UPI002B40257C|nr:uncharacterized protein LOC133806670 [Humulus lupulus]